MFMFIGTRCLFTFIGLLFGLRIGFIAVLFLSLSRAGTVLLAVRKSSCAALALFATDPRILKIVEILEYILLRLDGDIPPILFGEGRPTRP